MAEDERILRRLKLGDLDAMDEIMTRYMPYVVTVILNQLGSRASKEDAEEQASNVFYSLWTHRKQLRTTNLRGWLAAAARNEAIGFLRKNRPVTVDIDDCIMLSDGSDIQTDAEKSELAACLRETLGTLDPQSREVFVRHYYYGQTVSAIAEEMSLGLSNVKSRLQRGRARLKDELFKGGYCCEG